MLVFVNARVDAGVSFVLSGLRPLELLIPGPRLSKATEATLARYCESAVDSLGDRRVVRTERLPPEEFCFEAAQVWGNRNKSSCVWLTGGSFMCPEVFDQRPVCTVRHVVTASGRLLVKQRKNAPDPHPSWTSRVATSISCCDGKYTEGITVEVLRKTK